MVHAGDDGRGAVRGEAPTNVRGLEFRVRGYFFEKCAALKNN